MLGILAREQDGYTRSACSKGCSNLIEALRSPEEALQLLSYDIHAMPIRLHGKL